MLISVSFENWKSFRNSVIFSMVAGRERLHKERAPYLDAYSMNVLPIAAIYGGNASGKSNFIEAMAFARSLIVDGTKPNERIPIQPFRLEDDERPTRFAFEILCADRIYDYGFTVTYDRILEEHLTIVYPGMEQELYARLGDQMDFMTAQLNEDQRLRFVWEGTRDNQLFLTNAISQKVERFKPITEWFERLKIVTPEMITRNMGFFTDPDHPATIEANAILAQMDTGIDRIGGEVVPLESVVPEGLPPQLLKRLPNGHTMSVNIDGVIFSVQMVDGKPVARRVVTYHAHPNGSEVPFNLRDESDGTQRLIQLLPALNDLTMAEGTVYLIDEIDRSLHTLLLRAYLERYLDHCSPASRNQLVFTTHDVLTMDQRLLRRDEMWVVERAMDGASTLFSFSEYKELRHDTDIRKNYLQGRLGGIPRILLSTAPALKEEEDGE